jgi:hypothetical protein
MSDSYFQSEEVLYKPWWTNNRYMYYTKTRHEVHKLINIFSTCVALTRKVQTE